MPILREVQEARCFYCGREVRGEDEQRHINHFIPWSRYPVDLGHNFVLAHGECNLAKSDHLAATEHLARWAEHNRLNGVFLVEQFDRSKIIHDLQSSVRITWWAYEHTATVKALTWVKGKQFEPLDAQWAATLSRIV